MSDFCYWEAKSLPDCLLVYLNLFLTCILAYFTIKSLIQTNRSLRGRVIAIYIGVFLWIVTNAVKNLYAILIYHMYVTTGEFNIDHSKIFAILDTPPAVVVQTLFLAIPYMMWKNVMRILNQMHLQRSIEEDEFLNYYTFYLTIRFVILFLPWLALIIMPSNHSAKANFVKLSMQLLDSLIINILLIGSLSAFLKRFKQIKLDSQQDKKKLKWQYSLMVIFSTFRFFIDLAFLIILPLLENSECISPMSDHYAFSIGYSLIGSIIMHIIPIGLVLYIYKPEAKVKMSMMQSDNTE